MSDASADGWPSIPGYTIEALLGEGGFALVYRAIQDNVGRPVALKVLNRGPEDAEAVKAFRKEVRAIGLVSDHDHVVTVYDAGTTGSGRAFIAMQLLPGGSFADLLDRSGPLPPDQVARVGREIASALGAAHEAGIVHRDLKPQNLLMGPRGRALLSDFGIASIEDATRTTTGRMAFTLPYLAPEALRGERRTPASDVFALGATLYTLASGHLAFARDGDSSETIVYRLLSEDPPPLPGVPGWLADAIASCLEKDPADRPHTDELFERRFSPAPAAPPPPPPRTAPSATVPSAPPASPRPAPVGGEVRFGVVAARSPAELAEIVVGRWSEAVERLDALAFRVDLVAAIGSAFGPDAVGTLGGDWQAGRRFGPHRRVAELVATLDPGRTPQYDGLVVTDRNLADAAHRARSGDTSLRRTLDRLYEEQALVSLARHDGHDGLLGLNTRWRHEVAAYEARTEPGQQNPFALVSILQALCRADAATELVRRAQQVAESRSSEAWVQEVLTQRDRGPGTNLAIAEHLAPPTVRAASSPSPTTRPRRWWRGVLVVALVALAAGGITAAASWRTVEARRDELAAEYAEVRDQVGDPVEGTAEDVASRTPYTLAQDGCVFQTTHWLSFDFDTEVYVDRGATETQVDCPLDRRSWSFDPGEPTMVTLTSWRSLDAPLEPTGGGEAILPNSQTEVAVDVNLVPAAAVAAGVLLLGLVWVAVGRRS